MKLICLLCLCFMYNVIITSKKERILGGLSGVVFNIQRFSIHDGPGIRTVIFFKGCNLKCKWCHNPESISFKNEVKFYDERCICCGNCFKLCPCHYIENDTHIIDREKCTACLKCTKQCYSEALVGVGERVDVDYIIKAILQDELYYRNSGGGVTFSGGEAMLQTDFLAELLKECKKNGIHTAIDTAGAVPFEFFEKVLEHTDLFLYDIKAATPELHIELTGKDNIAVISNLKKLSDLSCDIIVRVPYIPTMNDKEMPLIADILTDVSCRAVELLGYHKLGDTKYSALSVDVDTAQIIPPTREEMKSILKIFTDKNINATIK